MKIRELRAEDIKRCREIMISCLDDMTGMDDLTKRFFAKRTLGDEFANDLMNMRCVVAEVDGTIAGMGALKANEIQRMYCDPSYRGKHIGSTIYKHLEEIAKSEGIRKLRLESSLNAEGFYFRLGFNRVGIHQWNMEGHQVQNVIMQKSILEKT